jgi:hypothetical protein
MADKGVICKIAEPEEMPADIAGNRATLSWMSNNGPYEHWQAL